MSELELAKLAVRAARAAAPIFEREGWEWHGVGVPDESRIAARLQQLLGEVKLGRSLGNGRLHVTRWLEADQEHYQIDLELGSVSKAVSTDAA